MNKRSGAISGFALALFTLLIPLAGHGLEPQEKWVARYNGPANGYDGANAIALDSRGNIFIAGHSSGSGTDDDYAIIKYNASGRQLWVRKYNGSAHRGDDASAIAVDRSGSVYVTGSSGGSGGYDNTDYATLKYNTNGQLLWVRRYSGVANGRNSASAIALDSSGNVYVTGTKESPDDDNATEFICDYATIKYNTNGKQLWVNAYNGPADGNDMASAIAVDGSGNVYVTGTSYGAGAEDYATIKYDTNGVRLWVQRHSGPGTSQDDAIAMAVDRLGNVHVTGTSRGDRWYDYATLKYDTNGKRLWLRTYHEPGSGNAGASIASAIAVDGAGNVYVVGSSYGSGGVSNMSYATLKYDAKGKPLWGIKYRGPDKDGVGDEASGMAVDRSGNVYVTGRSQEAGVGYSFDYATVKYNTNGKQLWVKRYSGPAGSYSMDEAKAIAVDGAGNVYVTGESEGAGTHSDMVTIKY